MTVCPELNHKPNRFGLYNILIRVTHNRKLYRTSSQIYIKNNQFDGNAKYGHWIVKHLDRDRLNNVLKEKITKIEQTYQRADDVTPQRALIADSLFKFAEGWIKKYDNEEGEGTYDHYNAVLTKLKKYGTDKLRFSEITVKFIRDYSVYLKTEYKNGVNTIGANLKKIRAIIREAVKQEVVEYSKNPFNKITIESKRTGKEKLNMEELDAIRNVSLHPTEYKYHARNVFLFCVNTMGMRIGSAMKIKRNQIQDGFLHYQMNKGGKTKNIELTDEAKKIVKQYKSGKYLFPYLEDTTDINAKIKSSTSMINKALRDIAEMAGIDKHLSTHVARHTLTKMAIDSGVDMRTLQGMLNHSSIKTTEDYAGDIADVKGNEALKKIFNKAD